MRAMSRRTEGFSVMIRILAIQGVVSGPFSTTWINERTSHHYGVAK